MTESIRCLNIIVQTKLYKLLRLDGQLQKKIKKKLNHVTTMANYELIQFKKCDVLACISYD